MTFLYHLLNNHFLIHELVFLDVFTSTASILCYLIFILRLGTIIIYFNKIFFKLNLSNQFIKKLQQYFHIFRILIILFILLKFIWIYDLLLYCLCISTVILLGLAFYRHRSAFAAISTQMSLSAIVIINSDLQKITVYPDNNFRQITKFNTVELKFEFNISNEIIQDIRNQFGDNVIDNVITGKNANQIVETYVMPLIESSDIHSLFLEIFNPF